MRVLADTNLLIGLEDTATPLGPTLAELVRLAGLAHWQILRHPASTEDLERDRDEKRREIVLSKLRRYPVLEHPPEPTEEFLQKLGGGPSPNDRCDNRILYAVHSRAVGLLVTEDQRLHKKARRAGLADHVYYIGQAVEALRALFRQKAEIPPVVKELPLYAVPVEDKLFDSLRADYTDPPFDNWYRDSIVKERRCWAVMSRSAVDAVCIYKPEQVAPLPDLPAGRWLKLCTFKVSEAVSGRKLGELLLKTAFVYGIGNGFRGVYVTVFPSKDRLISLFTTFGFTAVGTKPNGELILGKPFGVPAIIDPHVVDDPVAYNSLYYPAFLDGPEIRKFIVPVLPKYHRQLFPDAQHFGELWASNEAVSNAIRKAYLCNSPTRLVRPGDLLFFYRSQDLKSVTSLAVVEAVKCSDDADEIAVFVGKRTVYSYKDIKRLCDRGQTLAIMFRQISHAQKGIHYKTLKKSGTVRNHIESIVQIEDGSFQLLKKEFPP